MTVKDLINMLKDFDADAEVVIFDPDSGKMEPVSGATYDSLCVELQSDDVS